MRILFVEDDDSVVEDVRMFLGSEDFELVSVPDRDSAYKLLNNETFDFGLLDLKIRAKAGDLISEDLYGFAVYDRWLQVCPGAPLIIFSGFANLENTRKHTSASPQADVFFREEPSFPMLQVRQKTELSECVADIKSWNKRLNETLASVSISSTHDLTRGELIAIAALGRFRQAVAAEVRPTSTSGLSGSRTLLVSYKDALGGTSSRAFAKIGNRTKILDEVVRYEKHIPGLLVNGTFAPYIKHLEYGLGQQVAVFYDIVVGSPISLFEKMSEDDEASARVVETLQEVTRPWQESLSSQSYTLEQLRSSRIATDLFKHRRVSDRTFYSDESMLVELVLCLQHGDLHGENVLISDTGAVTLIDFGDVGPAPAGFDPITLELSLKFNVDSPFRNSKWPSLEQASRFWDLDYYLVGCPVPAFIKAVRVWLLSVLSERQAAAVFYAQSARQLKYEEEFFPLAQSYMNGALSRLQKSL